MYNQWNRGSKFGFGASSPSNRWDSRNTAGVLPTSPAGAQAASYDAGTPGSTSASASAAPPTTQWRFADGGTFNEDEDDGVLPTQASYSPTPDLESEPAKDRTGIKKKLRFRDNGMEMLPDEQYPQRKPVGTGAGQFDEPDAGRIGGDPMHNINAALQTVTDVLNYGRKKFGLMGQRDEQATDDQAAQVRKPSMDDAEAPPLKRPAPAQDEPNPDGSDEEVPRYAAGGMVEENDDDVHDNTPAPADPTQGGSEGVLSTGQQAPPRAMAYLSGQTKITSKDAQSIEQAIDPKNQMQERERRLSAVAHVAKVQGPEVAFELMQFYRQKYDAYRALSRAATKGQQQTQQAPQEQDPTQAFEEGGLVGPEADSADDPSGVLQEQPAKENGWMFDDSKTIKEKAIELFAKAYSYLPTNKPLNIAKVNDQFINGPDSLYDTILESFKKREAQGKYDGLSNAPERADAARDDTSFHEASPEQTHNEEKTSVATKPGKFKATVDQPIDPVKWKQANTLFPWASQGGQQAKFLESDLETQGKQDSAERIAELHGEQLANAARVRADTSRTNNENNNSTRRAAQEIAAKGLDQKQMQFLQKLAADAAKTNNVEAGKTLRAILAQPQGVDADQVNEALKKMKLPTMPTQLQAAPQVAAPQAQAPGAKQPQQSDIDYLKAHPEIKQKFDARFGAGASTRYLGQ